MKALVFALLAVLLVVGQVVTPVTAAPTALACGDTYVVQRGDYLSLIARTCGVTLTALLNANPEITNINRIFPGQVIRIVPGASIPVTGGTYTVVRGDTLSAIARRFGTTVTVLLNLNPSIIYPSLIYAGQVIRLPSGTTTNPGTGVPVTGTRISLSTNAVRANGQVTVSVWNFPANADIDFRLGKQGSAASVVVDSRTDSLGRATATITIPSTAVRDEKWTVLVLTTSQPAGQNTETTSPVITIIQ